jgi:5'-3' exonuclease
MGIPYYFASLIRQHKGITSRVTQITPDIFAIDFNCLIHTYMNDADPIGSILAALRDILTNTCRATKFVYIAMDGLVPYAKIVQQRYRRFRISEKGIFDRNQISPGTPYMRELAKEVAAAFPSAIVSSTDEPGEGEHKLLNWLKTLPATQRRSICVYGLDADLILLCLSQKELSRPHSFTLLRENSTFNKKDGGFTTLSVWKLAERLEIPIAQYIPLCVLCFGNDFMPSLGMFSLREGGHDRAIALYKEAGDPDLTTPAGRLAFLRTSAAHEMKVFTEKVVNRDKPAEKVLFTLGGQYFQERYNLHVLDGVHTIKPVVDAFWKTYEWTIRYFLTNIAPDWSWVYPYADAPLVSQLIESRYVNPSFKKGIPFNVSAQLGFILPKESLRKARRRVLFPDEFYEETEVRMPWMKRYAWESKPRISLPWHPTETETTVEAWDPQIA